MLESVSCNEFGPSRNPEQSEYIMVEFIGSGFPWESTEYLTCLISGWNWSVFPSDLIAASLWIARW